jgi:hypothetical protein
MASSKTNVSCLTCGVNFEKSVSEIKRNGDRHFCSRSCSAKTNNLGKRRYSSRSCKQCQKEYITTKTHRSLKLCQDCKSSHSDTGSIRDMSISDYYKRDSVKNKHPSWKSAHVRSFNRSWNKDLTRLSCQVCPYSTHVELAHIKAVSDFPEDTKLSIVNDPSNILVLCRNHHWEFDNGILKLQDIPPRKSN